MIFNNPLNFENGPDSSAAQMAERHIDINIGNWPLTFDGYGYAVRSDLGLAVIMVAALGLVVFLAAERFPPGRCRCWACSPSCRFFLWTLEAGKEPLSMPQQSGLLNYRFGLVIVIPAAILIGYLTARLPGPVVLPAALASILALAAMSGQSFGRHQVVLATEAARTCRRSRRRYRPGPSWCGTPPGSSCWISCRTSESASTWLTVRSTTAPGKPGRTGGRPCSGIHKPIGIRVIVMRLPNPAEPVRRLSTTPCTTRRG